MAKKLMCFVFVMSVALMLVSNVWAAKITVNGALVFDAGGFEADTVNANPSVVTPAGAAYYLTQRDGSNVDVVDLATPGANEGGKYLLLEKTSGGSNIDMGAFLDFSANATTNQTISAEFAFCADSAKSPYAADWDMHACFALAGNYTPSGQSFYQYGNPQTWVAFVPCGSDYYKDKDAFGLTLDFRGMGSDDLFLLYHNGTAWGQVFDTTGAPMSVPYDEWHDIAIDYTVGSGSYTFSIDDVTSANLTARGTADVAGLQMLANVSSTGQGAAAYYIDSVAADVPEPGTIALLLTGLFGLLVWKRR